MSLEKIFHLKENHTDVKTEILAGVTTFMTMAYILAVNPNILSESGMDRGAVFTATALASFIATCLMAALSNYLLYWLPAWAERVFYLYGCYGHGIFLADGTERGICGRYHLHRTVADQCA
mgnify:CR=1 FL=1